MTTPPRHVRPRVPSRAAAFAGLTDPVTRSRECPP